MRRLVPLCLMVLLAACTQGTTPTAASTIPGAASYRIATESKPGSSYMLADLTGVLDGEANPDGTACFWMAETGGRVALSWPYGYKARGPKLAVYNGKGKLVAVSGQRTELGGGGGAGFPNPVGCSGTFAEVFFAGPWIIAASPT